MRRLRDSLKSTQHANGNLWDDGPSGASSVVRLLRDLRDAIDFAAGVVPDEARTPEEPAAHADARLMAQKRDGKLRQRLLSVRGVP